MSDAIAGVTTAASAQVLLERSPQASRTIAALRYSLDTMRAERSDSAESAKLSPGALTFAEEIRRQNVRPEPQPSTGPAIGAAPSPRETPIAPPAAPIAALTVPDWQPPEAAFAVAPSSAAPPAEDAPLDLMQWTRGGGSDEMPPVAFDEPAPAGVIAPDIARLAEAEQNQIPREVLEIMRERHLGPTAAPSLRGQQNER
jgi:hypothetical protein